MRTPIARRQFIRSATLATAAAAAAPPPLLAAQFTGKIKKAVKFAMVTEKLGVTDKFKLLQDLGFDGVEVYTRNKDETNAYRKAFETTNFPVHGVVNSSDPDIVGAIEMASDLGGNSVLVLAKEDAKLSYDENFKNWQKLVRAAIPVAEKKKVRLLIENVRATFLKTAEGMARFIDSFETPWVGSYYDTGNTITWTEQNAEHWARVLGARISKIDIKDRGHKEFGDAKLAKPGAIGTDGGEVHWVNVRKELAKIGFTGWATAEVKGGDRKRLAGIAKWMDGVLRI
ncbi:MAG: L-ribulose-5-phosphate 3-epimerase [Limisphaerales bacterium]|jgi:L-ribulose-5-phosphate 3-epimerase